MPEAFSPSRSLKYCRITLRTVRDSSFSFPPSDLASDLVLCCKRHLFVVFELGRALGSLVEKARDGGELGLGGLEGIHAGAEHGGIPQSPRVPADVLARHARAALRSIESIKLLEVAHQHHADLRHAGRRELRAGRQVMGDLAEDPRTPLRGAPDHDRV